MQASKEERIKRLNDIGYAVFAGEQSECWMKMPEELRHTKMCYDEALMSALIKAIATMIVEKESLT